MHRHRFNRQPSTIKQCCHTADLAESVAILLRILIQVVLCRLDNGKSSVDWLRERRNINLGGDITLNWIL